jgi:N-acetyl-anhydromuramyl-L-alanine amidase AmpD
MNIIEDLIPLKAKNRPNKKIKKHLGVIIHYVGCNQPNAKVFAKSWKKKIIAGATHYLIDYNTGEIIRCVPEDEVTYHVGAFRYTKLKEQLVGKDNPNNYYIGIECCVADINNSKPSAIQYKTLVELTKDICKRYKFTKDQVLLHNNLTGKRCHRWYVDTPANWDKFKNDVFEIQHIEDKDTMVVKIVKINPKSYLKVRNKPSIFGKEIGKLINGDKVWVREEKNGWSNLGIGWVATKYLV